MLNKLYSFSEALESERIFANEWNRENKQLPKVNFKDTCVRIWISADGSVCEMESISAVLAQSLRKFGNNQMSFTAFNIAPLYRITDEEQLFELESAEKEHKIFDLDKIKSWCVNDNWQNSLVEIVNRNIHGIAQQMLKKIGGQEDQEYGLISALVGLTNSFSNELDKSFKAALEECIFMKLQMQDDINMALSLLFHKGDLKKDPREDIGTSLSIILNLADW